MAVRCEYCGQLYEGLSCPHCCAPRGESEKDKHVESDYDPTMTVGDFYGIFDGIKEMCDPEWILTNSSCVGNNNVQVIGDNNVVNGVLYADDVPYWVSGPVEGTCDEHVEDELEKVDDTHHAEKRCNKDEVVQDGLLAAITWFGVFSMSVIIGVPIILSIVIATAFCGILFGLMNINDCDD